MLSGVNHYEVLGVAQDASPREIRSAYRKLARELHPDVTSQLPTSEREAATNRFKQLAIAYECLSDPERRKAYDQQGSSSWQAYQDEPYAADYSTKPQTIVQDGVSCIVTILPMTFQSYATILIPYEGFWRLEALPRLPVGVLVSEIAVINDEGNIVASSILGFAHLKREVKMFERLKAKKTRYQQALELIQQLWQDAAALQAKGYDVTWLYEQIATAENAALRTADAHRTLKLIKTTIDEMTQRCPAAAYANDLLKRHVEHPDFPAVLQTVKKINEYAIRSGGFIELFTDDMLRTHLENQLSKVNGGRFFAAELSLNLEDHAPAAVVQDLELAPEKITIVGGKRQVDYAVDYYFQQVDGQVSPVGVLTLPVGVYERNAFEYGKPSKFAVLPYGILLIIKVVDRIDGKDKLVAEAEDGKSLAKRVAAYQDGRRRSKNRMPFH